MWTIPLKTFFLQNTMKCVDFSWNLRNRTMTKMLFKKVFFFLGGVWCLIKVLLTSESEDFPCNGEAEDPACNDKVGDETRRIGD